MKNNILHTLIILGCLYLCTFMSAVSAQEKNDSMKISKSFLKELENAFSFENERMQSAPINTLKPQELNREFLQELVGPVNLSPGVTSLNIPGLDKYYPMSGLPAYGQKDSIVLVKKDK